MVNLNSKSCHIVEETSNREFFEQFARAGQIGLIGGSNWIHRGVRIGQALLPEFGGPSLWSHVVVFKDGGHLYESDIMVKWQEFKLVNGAQENPIGKYFDDRKYPYLAALDFQLDDEQIKRVLEVCRKMNDDGVLYPISGLIGTALAYIFHTEKSKNVWSTENALYCSAYAQKSYEAVGIDFIESVHTTHTSPEHIWRTAVSHEIFIREKERIEIEKLEGR
jgi:hypothetical protein